MIAPRLIYRFLVIAIAASLSCSLLVISSNKARDANSALLLEVNAKLTPNMVKMILMYTAQPLTGFNTFEQGAGQLNIAGAAAMAKLVRSDFLALTAPSLGSPFLSQAAPSAQTTISEHGFSWAQGLVVNHGVITGQDLLTRYQRSYGIGYLLGDAVVETMTSQSLNALMWTTNVALGDNLMMSDGGPMGSGELFRPTGIMLAAGIMLADRIMLADGI